MVVCVTLRFHEDSTNNVPVHDLVQINLPIPNRNQQIHLRHPDERYRRDSTVLMSLWSRRLVIVGLEKLIRVIDSN